jgi:catechol 2,3-dioxygenase-like lactoylglutathione lyase family enzyme
VHDHVTVGVSDLDRAKAFYDAALAPLELSVPYDGEELYEWGDFSISKTGGRAVTRRAHFAFAAPSRAHVDAFWRAATSAGGRDNGPPGLRPVYHEGYYGAYVLDPDGNNVEAVFHGSPGRPGAIDHVSIRVRRLGLAQRFYRAVLEPLAARVVRDDEQLLGLAGAEGSLWVGEGEPTQNLHFAFVAPDNASVDAFWQAGVDAGFIDNGPPHERPQYHKGYYAAFLLDPDGNNVEAVCHNR